jgi:hypothetical protein
MAEGMAAHPVRCTAGMLSSKKGLRKGQDAVVSLGANVRLS